MFLLLHTYINVLFYKLLFKYQTFIITPTIISALFAELHRPYWRAFNIFFAEVIR